jgi:DNA-binding NarL/FixJ family response regulator
MLRSPGAPSPHADLHPSVERRGPGPRLVVVDDDAAFRSQLRELLEEEGFHVVAEGADGWEGVRIALEHDPDVVLMDVRMPVLGGIEAAGIIRDRLPRTQVIILSAYEDAAMTRGAESVGVYCYLVKGCRPDLITQMIVAAHSFDNGAATR